jgi:hypothetical protein
MTEVSEAPTVQENEQKGPSSRVLEKAWERAKPVLKTVVGGTILVGAALLTKGSISATGVNFFVDKASSGALTTLLAVNAALLWAGGVTLVKEPVRDAFNFFKGLHKNK